MCISAQDKFDMSNSLRFTVVGAELGMHETKKNKILETWFLKFTHRIPSVLPANIFRCITR